MCYNVSWTIFYSVWGDKSLSKFVDIIFGNLILIPIYRVKMRCTYGYEEIVRTKGVYQLRAGSEPQYFNH